MPPRNAPLATPDAANVLRNLQVAAFDVYGINSLKTLDPPISELSGQTITDVSASADGRTVLLETADFRLTVDLARTGALRLSHDPGSWQPGGGPMPTARLITTSGLVLDFTEPAKTKRISVSLLTRTTG